MANVTIRRVPPLLSRAAWSPPPWAGEGVAEAGFSENLAAPAAQQSAYYQHPRNGLSSHRRFPPLLAASATAVRRFSTLSWVR